MSQIIDGKKLALVHQVKLFKKIKKLKVKPAVVSILVGNNPASLIYSKLKQQKGEELGIDFRLAKFNDNIPFEKVVQKIEEFNNDVSIHGVMVQLPILKKLLGKLKADKLLQKISPTKDVDGLTGKGPVLPATVRGVISILKSLKINFQKNIFAVVGSKGMIGKEMVEVLERSGTSVIEIDKKSSASSLDNLKKADIVISCVGEKNLILPQYLKNDVILVDVGLGDFDPSCFKNAQAYTPEKGGVGPMTIISLMENVVELVHGTTG